MAESAPMVEHQQSAPRQNKALQNGGGTAFAAGIGIGGPLGGVTAWILGLNGIEVPAEIAVSFGGIYTAVIGYITSLIVSDS